MKRFCFLLLVLVISFSGFSQKTELFNNIGVYAGPGMSHILGGESWDPMFGFILGVETNVCNICKSSSLTAGIFFTQQGAKYAESYSSDSYFQALKSAQFDDISYSGKVSLSYIYIPILYNYRAQNGWYLEGGIQPGFLLRAKDEYDGGESEDYKEAIKNFDFGVSAGGGFWINERVRIGARATYGLTTIDTEESMDYDLNNRNFTVFGILGINFSME